MKEKQVFYHFIYKNRTILKDKFRKKEVFRQLESIRKKKILQLFLTFRWQKNKLDWLFEFTI